MKFCWCTITVKDMDESLRFYQDIIGLPLNRRYIGGESKEIAFLGNGETMVELISYPTPHEVSFGADIALGFEVKSLEDTQQFLRENGIGIHSGPFQPNEHIKFLYILDPNGLRIQFVENM